MARAQDSHAIRVEGDTDGLVVTQRSSLARASARNGPLRAEVGRCSSWTSGQKLGRRTVVDPGPHYAGHTPG